MNNFSNLYKNNINKEINNNKEYCYLDNIVEKENIDINDFFKKIDKIYKYKYYILTNDKEYKTYLIGKSDNYLVTFNEEKIPIEEVKNIEIIK